MAISDRFGANRYSPNFRPVPLPFGNLIPNVTHSDSVRPHSDVAAAAWLPLSETQTNQDAGFFVTQEEQTKDFIVITPGKLVAVTRESLGLSYDVGPVGRLVPAGVRIAWAAAAGGNDILEYTATDVAQFIEDLTTGAPVAAAVSYTKTEVETALVKRGLLRPSESAEDFISAPVGVIPQSAYAWCGGDGLQPAGYRFHNYKRQHKSQLLCDWALRLPYVPSSSLVSRVAPAISATVAAIGEVETPASGTDAAWITGAGGELATLGLDSRYGTPAHSDYVAAVLGAMRIEAAPHLPFRVGTSGGTDKSAQVLVRRVNCIDDLSYDGDYYIDTEMGIVFFYEAGGNALPNGLDATDLFVFSQHSVHVDAISALVSVVGDVRPGDYLVCDAKSNFRPFVARPAETQANNAGSADYVDPATYDNAEDIVAQVLTFSRYPDESMDKVKTFYDNLPTGLADKMPGSATGGYTDNLTYAGGGQFEVVINLLK